MVGPGFSVSVNDVEKHQEKQNYRDVDLRHACRKSSRERTCVQCACCRKKVWLVGKQFFMFSDPLCEATDHSDPLLASKDRNYFGGLIRWLL